MLRCQSRTASNTLALHSKLAGREGATFTLEEEGKGRQREQ